MEYNDISQYWIWLSSVEGIGARRFYQLLTLYEDPRQVWEALDSLHAPPEMRFLGRPALDNLIAARDAGYFYRLFDRLERCGCRAIPRIDDAYPADLNTICDPPPTLYVRGDAEPDDGRRLAIVGSRRCTRDGQRAAREFARELAGQGVCVISGMARGIDSCAHRGCLEGSGHTVAVLGCGVDVVYPPENEALRDEILGSGGAVISEYPPGAQPLSGHFPPRNRIISGLSRGTLLVEGTIRSGAMITVNDALEQGRDVFAVPGSIYSPLSAAPNRMILEGAVPVLSAWDILEYYRWAQRPAQDAGRTPQPPQLNEDERKLVQPLSEQELTFDELTELTGFSAAELNSHLTTLELRGIIEKVPGGAYRAYI